MNESDTRTARRIASIEAATTDCALSALDISEAISICHQSALDYVRYLLGPDRKTGERIHIGGWYQVRPGNWAALYRWGAGKNKRKPKPQTHAEAQREYRKRIREREALATMPQSWMSALVRAGSMNAEG